VRPHDDERRPIFSFLWPVPPKSSEPAITYQTRFVRIGTRGTLRILILIALAVGIAISAGGVILVGFSLGFSGWTFFSSALLATACVLLARASVSGTYVNDDGIAIRKLWSSRFFPWAHTYVFPEGSSILVHHSGRTYDTHIRRRSIDWPTGGERFDMAVQAIRSWASAHQAWGPESS
jgi:hypothetical protein